MRAPLDPRDPRNIWLHKSHMIELPKFKDPKSPCFLVRNRFFRIFGANVSLVEAQETQFTNEVRFLDVTTDQSSGKAHYLRAGESLNIYDRRHPRITERSISFEPMTPEEIEECSREYVRIPRNTPYGYKWEWHAANNDFGDTFLAAKVSMKKRYPPPEENELPENPVTYSWNKGKE